MRFARVDNGIKVCASMLKGAAPVELESYLISYLLVITYAEYEEALQKIIQARIARGATDGQLHNFIRSYIKKKSGESRLGRISIRDLAVILERFGNPCKTAFCNEITNKQPHHSWDLIVDNRHTIAHPGGQLNVSFREFQDAYRHSQQILNAFARACGLTAKEISGL
jgi:hypothetical protein